MYEYRARVIRIVDADTFDVEVDLGFGVFTRQRLRLARIDAWEMRGEEREQGLAATAYVIQRLEKFEYITIKTNKDSRGKYGRYIAEILVGDDDLVNLNDELVKEGHAEYWSY